MDAPQQAAETTTPGAPSSIAPRVDSSTRFMFACLGLVLLGLIINLLFVTRQCPLDLSGDEAHYWDWSRHLELSYYSKGPLVAFIIAAGRWTAHALFPNSSLDPAAVVRLPAVLLSALTSIGVITLCREVGLSWRGTFLALLICASVPMFTVGAVLMTIDAPFLCAWIWIHVVIVKSLNDRRSGAWWLVAASIVAVGILAKYTMVLIYAAIGVTLWVRPNLRRRLLNRWSITGGLLGLLGFVPILMWNAGHGWVSFRHVAGQAGVAESSGFNIGGPIDYIVSQLGVSNPIWIGMLLMMLITRPSLSSERDTPAGRGIAFLKISTIVVFLVFLGFSFVTKIQPNWPAPAILTGTILLAAWTMQPGRELGRQTRVNRWVAGGIVLGLAVAGLGRRTDLLAPVMARMAADAPPWELTPAARYDPAARLRGWHELGAAIGEAIAEQSHSGQTPIILTDDYQSASEIAFYASDQPEVYCIQSVLGDRLNQYDVWENPIDNPAAFVGRPCVYVGTLPGERTEKGRILREMMPGIHAVRTVEHRVRSVPMQVWTIFFADAYRGIERPTSKREPSY